MPMLDGESISPDEAMRRGLCPECGVPFTTAQMARAHADDHWGQGRGFLSAEGARRRELVLKFAAAKSTTAETPPPEIPSHDNRPFWIDQIIAGAIFLYGLEIARDHLALGAIVTVIGLVWLFYLRLERRPMTPQVRAPNVIAVAVLFLATVVIGYDIYDRHYGNQYVAKLIPEHYEAVTAEWKENGKNLPTTVGEDLSHRIIVLDGHAFVNCQVGDTHFIYQGEKPTALINCKVTSPGIISLHSDNPAIRQALTVMSYLQSFPGGQFQCVPDPGTADELIKP